MNLFSDSTTDFWITIRKHWSKSRRALVLKGIFNFSNVQIQVQISKINYTHWILEVASLHLYKCNWIGNITYSEKYVNMSGGAAFTTSMTFFTFSRVRFVIKISQTFFSCSNTTLRSSIWWSIILAEDLVDSGRNKFDIRTWRLLHKLWDFG